MNQAGASTMPSSASLSTGAVFVAAGLTCLCAQGASIGRAAARRRAGSRTACSAAFDASKAAVGVTAPLGYWDPVGLMKDGSGNWKDEAVFNAYQDAEIKHGRVAMMAAAGLVANTFWKWPGFTDVPGGFAALSTEKGGGGFGILVLLAGFFELVWWKKDPSKEPGNLGDPAGVMSKSDGDDWDGYSTAMRNREINHGRLAMSAFAFGALAEYGGNFAPAEQLKYLVDHGLVVVFIFLALIWQQTPEEAEKGMEKVLTAQGKPLNALPEAPAATAASKME